MTGPGAAGRAAPPRPCPRVKHSGSRLHHSRVHAERFQRPVLGQKAKPGLSTQRVEDSAPGPADAGPGAPAVPRSSSRTGSPPTIRIPTGVRIPVVSMSIRARAGAVQALLQPGRRAAQSSRSIGSEVVARRSSGQSRPNTRRSGPGAHPEYQRAPKPRATARAGAAGGRSPPWRVGPDRWRYRLAPACRRPLPLPAPR